MNKIASINETLLAENTDLRARLEEAEEMLRAIRAGEVDALVVETTAGPKLFTLQGVDAAQNSFRGEMLAQVSDAVLATDLEERLTFLNAAAERQYGVRASEVLGHGFAEIYTRHWLAPDAEAGMWTALGERGEWRGELIHRTLDGRELHVEKVITSLHGPDGERVGHVAAIRDITERKRAEETLREKTHFLQRIAEVTPGVLHVFDLAERRAVFINRTVASLLGFSPQEVQAMGADVVPTLMHPNDLPRFEQHLARIATLADSEVADFEFLMRDRAGEWHWFRTHDAVFARDAAGGARQLIGVATETTERKRAEAQLWASEARLRLFIENAPAGIAHFDREMRYVAASRRWLEDYGLTGEVIGRLHYDLFPELPEAWKAAHRRAMAGETLRSEGERFDRADGSVQWVKWEMLPWRDATDGIGGIVIAAEDITARKQAEDALSESEGQFRAMADSIPQLAWTARPDGFIHSYNRRWYEYTGTTAHSMEGWGWQSVHDPQTLPQVLERWKASIASGESFEMIFPLRGADGEFRPFLTRVIPLKDAEGCVTQWFGTNTDVEELKRAVRRCTRARRVSAASSRTSLSARPKWTPRGVFYGSTTATARSPATPAKSCWGGWGRWIWITRRIARRTASGSASS